MDSQLSPRLQEFWFNALPGRFMQLRGVASTGNIWEIEQSVNTILNILPKAGIKDDELEPFLREVEELRIQCFAIRAGKAMYFYNSMLENSTAAERYAEIIQILKYVDPIVAANPNIIIGARLEVTEEADASYTALALSNKLRLEQSELMSSFSEILDSLLDKLKQYSLQMDMDNFFFDLRLRTRKLELGIDSAKKYAEFLGKDISEEIEGIQITAYQTMGLDLSRLQ